MSACSRYAAAGRSREKLTQVLNSIGASQVEVRERPSRKEPLRADLHHPAACVAIFQYCTSVLQVVLAETEDTDALLHMAQSSRYAKNHLPKSSRKLVLDHTE